MNPEDFVVGGVSLIAVVFGLVEFLKANLPISGKTVTVLAAALGALLMVAYQLQTILPAPYAQVYVIVVQSVTFGLCASGYYKFLAARLPKSAK